MNHHGVHWNQSDYTIEFHPAEVAVTATEIYERVCRTTLQQPGFCVVHFSDDIDSHQLRSRMLALNLELSRINHQRQGKPLIALSALRVDQQTTTKPHLDGGPEESLLLLGYEPTAIASEVSIFDFSACASQHKLTPQEFLRQHNPMFQYGFEVLIPYRTTLQSFDSKQFQIVVINNSSTPADGTHWLGTLHTASILQPDEKQRRIVNSMMLAPKTTNATKSLGEEQLTEFVRTTAAFRRGYDKHHLNDDTDANGPS